jgi:hypothetical protein
LSALRLCLLWRLVSGGILLTDALAACADVALKLLPSNEFRWSCGSGGPTSAGVP